jgi:tRNA threonylcarbamoyladenosine biosynthesis protein TsaE
MTTVELFTADEDETRAIGLTLAKALRGGERIGLSGELGAGKTCFVRGLGRGAGIPPEDVRSPSFPILIPYENGKLPLYHIDLFRLPAGDIDSLSLREYIYGAGVCAIEWPERLDEPLADHLEIRIEFIPGGRRLLAVAHGSGYGAAIEALGEIRAGKTLKK